MASTDQQTTLAPTPAQERVIADVLAERQRQNDKWGPQFHHPLEWLSILGEEYGEACKAANEGHWGGKYWIGYREELVQVIAVAFAAIERLDANAAVTGDYEP